MEENGFFIENTDQSFNGEAMVSICRHDKEGGGVTTVAFAVGKDVADARENARRLARMLAREEAMKTRLAEIDEAVKDLEGEMDGFLKRTHDSREMDVAAKYRFLGEGERECVRNDYRLSIAKDMAMYAESYVRKLEALQKERKGILKSIGEGEYDR